MSPSLPISGTIIYVNYGISYWTNQIADCPYDDAAKLWVMAVAKDPIVLKKYRPLFFPALLEVHSKGESYFKQDYVKMEIPEGHRLLSQAEFKETEPKYFKANRKTLTSKL